MGSVPQLVQRGEKDRRMGEPSEVGWEVIEGVELDARVELIQALIPLALAEVGRTLNLEVEQLAGARHARKADGAEETYRHGSPQLPRSVLRGSRSDQAYDRLYGSAGEIDEGLFRKVLLGISCRDYEAAVEAVPGAIGLSKWTVSREFKKATARQRKAFQERDLSELDVAALFTDGKTFADDQMVIALAVTLEGDKEFVGFVQTDTENGRVIADFLRSLKTTNVLESVNAQAEQRCGRVDRWRNSNH